MITWGVSAGAHDAALAVFVDEKLAFASESERFSKKKNDPDLCPELVNYAIRLHGMPDRVCWYERPWKKALRKLFAGQKWELENPKAYMARYGITDVPILTTDHHKSHAAAGYYSSSFEDACIVVLDAIGEFKTFTIWGGHGDKISYYMGMDYPDSAGLFYTAMTQRVGLKPIEEEYILMGMAAYGDPNRLSKDMLKDFVRLPTGEWDGYPFGIKQNLHRGCSWWRPELNTQQDHFDIAAAAQSVYEMMFERVLQTAFNLTGSRNLVLMGGCALNCSANPIAYKYFDNVWIMPAPGDNGSAIGAVLAQTKQHLPWWPGPYLGYDMGYVTSNEDIVKHLLTNKMCGVARGRAEFGPRALGNRSLLADPRDPRVKERVNDIKQRQQFRPFAPAIIEELADKYFEMPMDASPYMQHTVKCKDPKSYPAVVHADGTSRVQTVNSNDNPEFYALLKMWYEKSGCPMLLNTSLNVKGQPMVNDRADALTWSQKYGLPVFN